MWPQWSYVRGVRIDYLSPTIYLTDILILVLLLVSLLDIDYRKDYLSFFKKYKFYFLFIFIFSIINVAFSANAYLALYKWLTFYKFIYLGIYVFLEDISTKEIAYVLSLSLFVIFFSFTLQLLAQKSETRLFYFWGERRFFVNTPSIARFAFLGKEYLRPYAFFPHPNALAGFSLVAIPLLSTIHQKVLKYLSIFMASIMVLLSISQAAWISGIVIFSLFFSKIKVRLNFAFFFILLFSFLTPIFFYYFTNINPSIGRRYNLSLVSIYMVKDNPFFGVGLGNFIYEIFSYYQRFHSLIIAEARYWIQPVHNIFLLLLSETGFVGLILVFVFIYKKLRKNFLGTPLSYSFFGILLTGLADHYWLTLQQTQLMLTLVFTMFLKEMLLAKKIKSL